MADLSKKETSLLTAAIYVLLMWAAVSSSSAAVGSWTDCPQGGASGGGGHDAAGTVYVSCGTGPILVYGPSGQRLPDIDQAAGSVTDVAASPDGSKLYLARGRLSPLRMSRQAGGSYKLDDAPTWTLASYPYQSLQAGAPLIQANPQGHNIDTDSSGNIYLSDGGATEHGTVDGSWDANHNRIVKYSPAGVYVTQFGRQLEGSSALGDFHGSVYGVAAVGDGATVLAVDQLGNRIHRFQRQPNGSYLAVSTFGGGWDNFGCAPPLNMSSPYDVSVDADGSIFVLNTTCENVLMYNAAGSKILEQFAFNGPKPHAFAVSGDGCRIYVNQSRLMAIRDDCGEGPGPVVTCNGKTASIVADVGTHPGRKVTGTAGDDVIVVEGSAEFLIEGKAGDDTICGGSGYDTIRPGSGSDWINGGGAANALDYSDSAQGMLVDMLAGTVQGRTVAEADSFQGFNEIFGSVHADVLRGTARADFLVGNPGDDVIEGRGGNDLIWGDADWDPAPGHDVIDPGGGVDTVRADHGDDQIMSRDSVADKIDCGAGSDRAEADTIDMLTGCEKQGGVTLPPIKEPPVTDPSVCPPNNTGEHPHCVPISEPNAPSASCQKAKKKRRAAAVVLRRARARVVGAGNKKQKGRARKQVENARTQVAKARSAVGKRCD